MPLLSQIVRKYPTSDTGLTNDPVGGLSTIDPLTGNDVALKLETFHEHGLPTRLLKIVSAIGSTSVRQLFPDNGTGILPASPAQANGLTIQLASGVLQGQTASINPRGMLLAITSGAAAGQYRVLTGVSGSFTTSQIVTVHRSWLSAEGVPAAGDTYDLLVDCAWAKKVSIFSEYSAIGTTNVLQAMPLLYDAGRVLGTFPTPTARAPWSMPDQVLTFANTGITAGALESALWARGRPSTIETRGFYGVKLYVVDIPSGLTVSVWAGAT